MEDVSGGGPCNPPRRRPGDDDDGDGDNDADDDDEKGDDILSMNEEWW